jgi:hypothetical protein
MDIEDQYIIDSLVLYMMNDAQMFEALKVKDEPKNAVGLSSAMAVNDLLRRYREHVHALAPLARHRVMERLQEEYLNA